MFLVLTSSIECKLDHQLTQGLQAGFLRWEWELVERDSDEFDHKLRNEWLDFLGGNTLAYGAFLAVRCWVSKRRHDSLTI